MFYIKKGDRVVTTALAGGEVPQCPNTTTQLSLLSPVTRPVDLLGPSPQLTMLLD
jgi:hypothetical protein